MMDKEFDKIEDEIDLVEINTTQMVYSYNQRTQQGSHFRPPLHCPPPASDDSSCLSHSALVKQPTRCHRCLREIFPQWNRPGTLAGFHQALHRSIWFIRWSSQSSNYHKRHTFPGIFLGLSPTGNRQGTHEVFNLNTGVVKKPCTVTLLPISHAQ